MTEYDGLKRSKYAKLFGTPERAAQTLNDTALCFGVETVCCDCPYKSLCDTQCDYDSLLGLLRGDA